MQTTDPIAQVVATDERTVTILCPHCTQQHTHAKNVDGTYGGIAIAHCHPVYGVDHKRYLITKSHWN